jgi:hypothetical protein
MCGADAGADAGKGTCVNTKHDRNNCGGCGNVCEAGACVDSVCR